MLIKSEFEVAESIDKVWAFLNDIPLVASCLPGADISEQVDEDRYVGGVLIKAGPVKLDFEGEATVVRRDEAARRIVVQATGADVEGRGQARMLVDAVVVQTAGGSRVHVDQDLHLSGAVAQYGRGLVQDVTAVLLDHFADNLRDHLEALEAGVTLDRSARRSTSGFSIAFRALRMGLIRVFRRFFLPYPSSG